MKKINYANLNSFINKREYDKISIKRLKNFIFFIKQNVGLNLILENNNEQHIIEKSKKEMKQEILKIIENYKGDN